MERRPFVGKGFVGPSVNNAECVRGTWVPRGDDLVLEGLVS